MLSVETMFQSVAKSGEDSDAIAAGVAAAASVQAVFLSGSIRCHGALSWRVEWRFVVAAQLAAREFAAGQ